MHSLRRGVILGASVLAFVAAAGIRPVAAEPGLATLLNRFEGIVNALAFSPDGRTLAVAFTEVVDGDEGADKVVLWDLSRKKEVGTLDNGGRHVYCLAFSPDGRILASGGDESKAEHRGAVCLWDVRARRLLSSFMNGNGLLFTPSISFSPDGKLLGAALNDAMLWSIPDGDPRGRLLSQSQQLHSLAFSPRGGLVAGGGDQAVVVWNVGTEAPKQKLSGHTRQVSCVAFSPDGKSLASSSDDQTIKLWDVQNGEMQHALAAGPVKAIAFSPAGGVVASVGNDAIVRVWDARSGQLRCTLAGHTNILLSVAFSPDGKVLASGGVDGCVKLWDVAAVEKDPQLLLAAAGDIEGSLQNIGERHQWSFAVPARKGDRLAVTMTSPAFAPYLVAGEPIAGLQTLATAPTQGECHIDLLAPMDGEVRMVATTQEPHQMGAYELRVRRVAENAPTELPWTDWATGQVPDPGGVVLQPLQMHAGEKLAFIAEATDFIPVVTVAGPTPGDKTNAYPYRWTSSPTNEAKQTRLEVMIPADGNYAVSVEATKPIKPGATVRVLLHQVK